ncbi:gamma subclass chorismate mutase AroQ [Streptomyces violaceoruber]
MKPSDALRRHTVGCASTAGSLPLAASQNEPAGERAWGCSRTTTYSAPEPPGGLGTLTELVIRRLLMGDEVAASKIGTGRLIDDPARERHELEMVRHQAHRLGLEPDGTTAFFHDQISASKIVQRGLFARWAAHHEQMPATRPDLNRIRTRLDHLSRELLQELQTTQRLRTASEDCARQLAHAVRSGCVVHRLDGLHRQALETATRSVCGGVRGNSQPTLQ